MTAQKQIKTTISVAMVMLVLLLAGLATVRAQETINSEDQTTTEPKTTIQERLVKRKAAYQTKLNSSELARLRARCKGAQVPLGPIRDKLVTTQKNRVNAYNTLQDRLNLMVTKVDDKADTTELQSQIKVLDEKITALEQSIADYRQAVSDLIEIDCATDPNGFKASLEEARSLLAKLKESSKDIRTYINDSIKPSLKTIRETLAKEQKSVIN